MKKYYYEKNITMKREKMAKRMDTKMLEKISNNISKNAEVTENRGNRSFVDEGLKITSLSFKVSEYEKIKKYCEKNDISMSKLIKGLMKEKGVI